MRPPTAALFALLVLAALAPAAGLADTDADTRSALVVDVDNATNYLSVRADAVDRTAFSTAELDLSAGFAMDSQALRAAYLQTTFESNFRAAETDADRDAAVRATLDRLEAREARLDHRNRAAVRGYANGSMATEPFLRERARIHAEAAHLQRVLDRVSRVASFEAGYSLPQDLETRRANLAGELEVLQGPASGRLVRATTAEAPPRSVYAEASSDGYTIAYVTEAAYVRETYLGNRRNENATDQFRESDEPRRNLAHNRGFELYPWVTDRSVSPNTFGLGTTGIYRFTVDYAGGELTAYIDGGTTDVFRESQRRQLDQVRTTPHTTARNGSLFLQVNRSFTTGPMSLTVTDTDTGGAVNATVTVDGHPVGATGEDGRVWAVQPRRPVRINATAPDGDRVTTTVSP